MTHWFDNERSLMFPLRAALLKGLGGKKTLHVTQLFGKVAKVIVVRMQKRE